MADEPYPQRSSSFRKAVSADILEERGKTPASLNDRKPNDPNDMPPVPTVHDADNSEFELDEKKKKSSRKRWRLFAENSSLHGLRLVVVRSSPWARLLWLFFLLAFTSCVIYSICSSIIKYFDFPIATLMRVENLEDAMPFPAVTLCPMTTLSKRKLSMRDEDERFGRLGLNISACDVTASVRAGRPCGEALLCCCSHNDYIDGSAAVDNCTEEYKRELTGVIQKNKESFNDREFWKAYGLDIRRMVIPGTCYFGSSDKKCLYEDFDPIVTEFGLCYSFNSAQHGKQVMKVTFSGLSSGLFLMLDLHVDDHAFGWYSEGVRVLIHNQHEYVDPWNGVIVSPGAHAQVSVSRKVYENKKYPYETNCDDSKVLAGFPRYTSEGCMYECLSNATLKECGCQMSGEQGNAVDRVCFRDDVTCVNNVNKAAMEDIITCDCPLACDVVKYDSSVSQAKFPNPSMTKILQNKGYNKSDDYLRKNLVFLQVGYKFLSYEHFRQKAQYDSGALMGEIGGNMGLFLGCSILTIFEFIDFAIFLCYNRRRR